MWVTKLLFFQFFTLGVFILFSAEHLDLLTKVFISCIIKFFLLSFKLLWKHFETILTCWHWQWIVAVQYLDSEALISSDVLDTTAFFQVCSLPVSPMLYFCSIHSFVQVEGPFWHPVLFSDLMQLVGGCQDFSVIPVMCR